MRRRLVKKRLKALLDKPYLCEVVGLTADMEYPFYKGETVLLIGEIEQMPGHVVFVNKRGQTHFGYHMSHFRKLSREES